MRISKHFRFWAGALVGIVLALTLAGGVEYALAAIFEVLGTSGHFGNTTLNLGNGQNLIWGELGAGSSGTGSFVLLQKAGVDKFRVDHNGALTSAGDVCTLAAGGKCLSAVPSSALGGSGTINYLSKFTAGTTLGNSQIFDNGTNVGIGTAGPGEKLSVSGNAGASSFNLLGDATYRWVPGSSWNTFYTPSGYIQLGPANSSYAHIYSNLPFYFNQNSLYANGSIIWHAGNDGSGSGLDADLVDGLQVHGGRNNEANKIVRTDVNGYIQAGWINTDSGDSGIANDILRIYASYDNYLRYLGKSDFKVLMGLSKNTYDRRDSTSDSNYWTGSMGWGAAYDWNSVFWQGNGFFDNWGTDMAGAPESGYLHGQGIQVEHYNNGSTGYGWQMMSGNAVNSNWYLRGIWGGGFGSWYKIIHSGNIGSQTVSNSDMVDGYHYNNLPYLSSVTDNWVNTTGDTMSGNLTQQANIIVNAPSFGKGLVGTYDSYKYRLVYSMGAAYMLGADGTTPGNLYGLAYTYDRSALELPQSKAGLGHQLVLMANGVTQTAIGTGIWTAGGITGTTLDTGLGANELYAMNQNVRTTDSPTFGEVYSNSWFRNYNRTGIYNQSPYYTHFYTDSAAYWRMSSNNGLILNSSAAFDSAIAGYLYHDANGFGLLHSGGGWAVRTTPSLTEIGPYTNGLSVNSSGNVGIGTTNPGTNKLEVAGGPIKATGGLIMETRTTNPAAPVVGQIWMCVDAGYDCL